MQKKIAEIIDIKIIFKNFFNFLTTTTILIIILNSIIACTKPPVAGINVDRNITEVGSPIQFTDQSTGEITTWSWSFGDGSGSNDPSPVHTYTKKGQYQISLKISNPAGTDEIMSNISVLEPPVANFSTSQTNIMINTKITFEDESTGDIDNWAWDFGDGTTSTLKNPSHIYENAGTYTVTLEVNNPVTSDIETKDDYIVASSLSINNMIFCSDVRGSGEYTWRKNDCFTSGEDVWIYFEVAGFEQRKTDDGFEALVNFQHVKYYDNKGAILFTSTDIREEHLTGDILPSTLPFWLLVGKAKKTTQFPVYTVEVTVEDKLNDQTATRSRGFLLE
jgi:PKD repeat protein